MSGFVTSIFDSPDREIDTKPLGVVVHVGAGRGTDLDGYLRRDAHLIVLVEANPALVRKLEDRCAGRERVRVVESAVAGRGGPRSFYVLNNDRDSSLHRPTALVERFPNVKIRNVLSVATISLGDLCAGLPLDDDAPHLLVIEAPGAEHEILSGADRLLIRRFSHLVVRVCDPAMYEDGSSMGDVDRLVRAIGFCRDSAAENSVPAGGAFRLMHYRRDDQAIRIETLLATVAEAHDRIAQLTGESNALAVEVAVLRGETLGARQQAQSRRDEIDQLRGELNELQAALDYATDDVGRSAGEIRALQDRLDSEGANYRSQFESLNLSVKEQTGLADTYKTRCEALEAEKSQLTAHLNEQARWLAEVAQNLNQVVAERAIVADHLHDTLQARIATLETDAEMLRQTLASRDSEVEMLRLRCQELESAVDDIEKRSVELAFLHQEQAGLAEARQVRCRTFQAERDALASELDATRRRCADAEHQIAECIARSDALVAELCTAKRPNEQTEAEMVTLALQAEQLQSERAEFERRLNESVITNGLTARLLKLRESDLADLRRRYATMQAERNERMHQLHALADRLQVAVTLLNGRAPAASALSAVDVPREPPASPRPPKVPKRKLGTK